MIRAMLNLMPFKFKYSTRPIIFALSPLPDRSRRGAYNLDKNFSARLEMTSPKELSTEVEFSCNTHF